MHIAIRVDGGGHCGLGHVHRMLAIAEELSAQVPKILTLTFLSTAPVCPQLGTAIRGRRTRWHLRVRPATDHNGAWVEQWCHDLRPDVLIWDTPEQRDALPHWQRLRTLTSVVRIDHPWAAADSCDLLVLPDMHTDLYRWPQLAAFADDALLVGPDAVLLRSAITSLQVVPWQHRPYAIVVAAGGVDQAQTLWHLHGLLARVPASLERHFLLPKPWHIPETVRTLAPGSVLRRFDFDVIRHARLLLCPLGLTVYEALWVGTPVCVLARTVRDAEGATKELEAQTHGAACAGPLLAPMTDQTMMTQCIQEQCEDASQWYVRHIRATRCLDGHGTRRVAAAILRLACTRRSS